MAKLYEHVKHPHQPVDVNVVQAEERTSLNDRIALAVTRALGTMWAAYLFCLLAIVGFPGFSATPVQYVQWLSQVFIQLVALAILGAGQSIMSRHQELQSKEMYNFVVKIYHEIEQMKLHMYAQDQELLKQSQMITGLLRERGSGIYD